jgi:hypothetical protein
MRGKKNIKTKVEFALEVLRLYAPHLLKNGTEECEILRMTDFINGALAIAS